MSLPVTHLVYLTVDFLFPSYSSNPVTVPPGFPSVPTSAEWPRARASAEKGQLQVFQLSSHGPRILGQNPLL